MSIYNKYIFYFIFDMVGIYYVGPTLNLFEKEIKSALYII